MNRFAVLIGSPSNPNTPEMGKYLEGVETDTKNFKRFLMSSNGGAWKEDEIKESFPNPKYVKSDFKMSDIIIPIGIGVLVGYIVYNLVDSISDKN